MLYRGALDRYIPILWYISKTNAVMWIMFLNSVSKHLSGK